MNGCKRTSFIDEHKKHKKSCLRIIGQTVWNYYFTLSGVSKRVFVLNCLIDTIQIELYISKSFFSDGASHPIKPQKNVHSKYDYWDIEIICLIFKCFIFL